MEVPDYTMTSKFQSGLEVTKNMAKKGLEVSCHIKNLTDQKAKESNVGEDSVEITLLGGICPKEHVPYFLTVVPPPNTKKTEREREKP